MGKVIGMSRNFYAKGNCWYYNIVEELSLDNDADHLGVSVKVTSGRCSNDFNPFERIKIGDDIAYFLKDDFGRLGDVKINTKGESK